MTSRLLEQPGRVALVECAIEIAASRARCFRVFVDDVAEWFYESEETKRTRPARLEPRVGGRFYLAHDDGDENLLAIVTLVKRDRALRLRGDFTLPQAFVANVTVTFEDAGPGTRVVVVHRMAGEFDDALPGAFDEGWLDGLEKVKSLVEAAGGPGETA